MLSYWNKYKHWGQLIPSTKYRYSETRSPDHRRFKSSDIMLIEWCINLGAIVKPRVKIIALPLKVKGADGAPNRAIVVEDDD